MSSNVLTMTNKVDLEKQNNVEFFKQKNFLESNLGQTINHGVDLGLKAVLPDLIEDDVIDIKNSIVTEGFAAGVKTAIDSAINMGKSVLGIFTGKFENMSQVENVIKKGGLLDSISHVLDWGIKQSKEKGIINKNTANVIKKGKDTILKTIDSNIEKDVSSQVKSFEKIDKTVSKWEKFYNNRDFKNMEKQFVYLKRELKKVMPIENILKRARQVENLHTIIKNKGGDFNLSKEELELVNKLI